MKLSGFYQGGRNYGFGSIVEAIDSPTTQKLHRFFRLSQRLKDFDLLAHGMNGCRMALGLCSRKV
jgi:hypothetical protein